HRTSRLEAGLSPIPKGWLERVNAPATETEYEAVRRPATRGAPLGEPDWQRRSTEHLGLLSSLPPPCRPRQSQLDPFTKAPDARGETTYRGTRPPANRKASDAFLSPARFAEVHMAVRFFDRQDKTNPLNGARIDDPEEPLNVLD